jgi:hypothetical protein
VPCGATPVRLDTGILQRESLKTQSPRCLT